MRTIRRAALIALSSTAVLTITAGLANALNSIKP